MQESLLNTRMDRRGKGGLEGETWKKGDRWNQAVSGLVENLLFLEGSDVEEAARVGAAETGENGKKPESDKVMKRHARPMHRTLLQVRVLVSVYHFGFKRI